MQQKEIKNKNKTGTTVGEKGALWKVTSQGNLT